MGNRRDAFKHSKAVSSSTESNSPTKSKKEKKPTDGEADKTEGEGIEYPTAKEKKKKIQKFAYKINKLVVNFQLCVPSMAVCHHRRVNCMAVKQ